MTPFWDPLLRSLFALGCHILQHFIFRFLCVFFCGVLALYEPQRSVNKLSNFMHCDFTFGKNFSHFGSQRAAIYLPKPQNGATVLRKTVKKLF